MELFDYIIPIIAVGALCAGWVVVQLLARRLKTKNHITTLADNCTTCTCGGDGECDNGGH